MEKSNRRWAKVFLGFGIITVLSGIYLLTQGDYLIGTSGSCVGFLLIYQNATANKIDSNGK